VRAQQHRCKLCLSRRPRSTASKSPWHVHDYGATQTNGAWRAWLALLSTAAPDSHSFRGGPEDRSLALRQHNPSCCTFLDAPGPLATVRTSRSAVRILATPRQTCLTFSMMYGHTDKHSLKRSLTQFCGSRRYGRSVRPACAKPPNSEDRKEPGTVLVIKSFAMEIEDMGAHVHGHAHASLLGHEYHIHAAGAPTTEPAPESGDPD
jgi:hypothetical protein